MAKLEFMNVGIKAVAACVPKNARSNDQLESLLGAVELEKVLQNIGIREMRQVSEATTPSDLCCAAAERLFLDNDFIKEDIDIVLFLSQNGDFKIPATSPSLQHRLGLPITTACLDLTLACSGYVYALSTAFAYASISGVNNVLLLVGETFSQIVSENDKVNAPLYGDAGTATLISKGDFGASVFHLYSDGSGADAIKIKAGGARCPANPETILTKERENGNFRTDHQLYMDGLEVFNFTLKVVPKSVKDALSEAGEDVDSIDYFVFHQANRFMIDFFVKKLKINSKKVPISLDTFGNVSSATIPLTMVTRLKNELSESNKKLLFSGFGAGLSWGTVILEMKVPVFSELVEL
jgi:3-oxoacyl-[acyl-carrier-protein] synthase-3